MNRCIAECEVQAQTNGINALISWLNQSQQTTVCFPAADYSGSENSSSNTRKASFKASNSLWSIFFACESFLPSKFILRMAATRLALRSERYGKVTSEFKRSIKSIQYNGEPFWEKSTLGSVEVRASKRVLVSEVWSKSAH